MSTHPDPESSSLPVAAQPSKESGHEHDADLPGFTSEEPQPLSEPITPVAIPPGVYVLGAGVTIWLVRRDENSDWECLVPLCTTVDLEVLHALCHRHPVQAGPESGDWTVVTIDGVPVLVRPVDLVEHVHERYVVPCLEDFENE
ncbi:MAG: hypothetical protein IPK50_13920 [Fibrobacterota bacterium]|nr:MAG: hypothetical protein IPK50_13920 [Fibrobacterota bacterium]